MPQRVLLIGSLDGEVSILDLLQLGDETHGRPNGFHQPRVRRLADFDDLIALRTEDAEEKAPVPDQQQGVAPPGLGRAGSNPSRRISASASARKGSVSSIRGCTTISFPGRLGRALME